MEGVSIKRETVAVRRIRYRDDYPLYEINIRHGLDVVTLTPTEAVSVRDQLIQLLAEEDAT